MKEETEEKKEKIGEEDEEDDEEDEEEEEEEEKRKENEEKKSKTSSKVSSRQPSASSSATSTSPSRRSLLLSSLLDPPSSSSSSSSTSTSPSSLLSSSPLSSLSLLFSSISSSFSSFLSFPLLYELESIYFSPIDMEKQSAFVITRELIKNLDEEWRKEEKEEREFEREEKKKKKKKKKKQEEEEGEGRKEEKRKRKVRREGIRQELITSVWNMMFLLDMMTSESISSVTSTSSSSSSSSSLTTSSYISSSTTRLVLLSSFTFLSSVFYSDTILTESILYRLLQLLNLTKDEKKEIQFIVREIFEKRKLKEIGEEIEEEEEEEEEEKEKEKKSNEEEGGGVGLKKMKKKEKKQRGRGEEERKLDMNAVWMAMISPQYEHYYAVLGAVIADYYTIQLNVPQPSPSTSSSTSDSATSVTSSVPLVSKSLQSELLQLYSSLCSHARAAPPLIRYGTAIIFQSLTSIPSLVPILLQAHLTQTAAATITTVIDFDSSSSSLFPFYDLIIIGLHDDSHPSTSQLYCSCLQQVAKAMGEEIIGVEKLLLSGNEGEAGKMEEKKDEKVEGKSSEKEQRREEMIDEVIGVAVAASKRIQRITTSNATILTNSALARSRLLLSLFASFDYIPFSSRIHTLRLLYHYYSMICSTSSVSPSTPLLNSIDCSIIQRLLPLLMTRSSSLYLVQHHHRIHKADIEQVNEELNQIANSVLDIVRAMAPALSRLETHLFAGLSAAVMTYLTQAILNITQVDPATLITPSLSSASASSLSTPPPNRHVTSFIFALSALSFFPFHRLSYDKTQPLLDHLLPLTFHPVPIIRLTFVSFLSPPLLTSSSLPVPTTTVNLFTCSLSHLSYSLAILFLALGDDVEEVRKRAQIQIVRMLGEAKRKMKEQEEEEVKRKQEGVVESEDEDEEEDEEGEAEDSEEELNGGQNWSNETDGTDAILLQFQSYQSQGSFSPFRTLSRLHIYDELAHLLCLYSAIIVSPKDKKKQKKKTKSLLSRIRDWIVSSTFVEAAISAGLLPASAFVAASSSATTSSLSFSASTSAPLLSSSSSSSSPTSLTFPISIHWILLLHHHISISFPASSTTSSSSSSSSSSSALLSYTKYVIIHATGFKLFYAPGFMAQ